MATRPSRKRSRLVSNGANVDNTRYDLSMPQNWTVVQLKAELQQNNIPFSPSSKKSRLIQLCKDNGLIDDRIAPLPPPQQAQSGAEHPNNSLLELTKTVAELQKTVLDLSKNVTHLKQQTKNADQGVRYPTIVDQGSSLETVQTMMANPLVLTNHTTQAEPFPPSAESCVPSTSFDREASSNSDLLASAMNHNEDSAGYVRTKYGYSAESLPFMDAVHPSLKKQILEGKDINLASLLIPYYTGPHADPSVITKERPDMRLNQELTLAQFIQAFGIYKNIMCKAYPIRRPELDLYERDILDMATRYPGNGFYEYHKMFSAQAAAHLSYSGKKVDWSVRNKTLFCSIFTNSKARTCDLCQSSLHLSSFCPKLTENNAQARFRNSPLTSDMFGRVRMQVQGSEICINFNSARGCYRIKCNYLHACLICHKEHSQQACQESKNLKSTINHIGS